MVLPGFFSLLSSRWKLQIIAEKLDLISSNRAKPLYMVLVELWEFRRLFGSFRQFVEHNSHFHIPDVVFNYFC